MARSPGAADFPDRRAPSDQISDLTNFPTAGNIGPWLGLGVDDSRLVLKGIVIRISTRSTGKNLEKQLKSENSSDIMDMVGP
jgi:hypothetical protein